MNTFYKYFFPATSIVAFILSITCLIRCEPIVLSSESLNWIIGVSISFIAIGVATILGVQIHNALTIEQKIGKRLKELEKVMDTQLEESFQESKSLLTCMSLLLLGRTQSLSNDHDSAFESMILSLIEANRIGWEDFSITNSNNLIDYMHATFKQGFKLRLSPQLVQEYKQGILGIKNERIGELIQILNEAIEE